ncbi:MAG TPA: hypothetical protein VFO85_20820, partial [Vicinamibacteria bacterium]|nr:hypothetical protein [Vicinamibacteria bacterium]
MSTVTFPRAAAGVERTAMNKKMMAAALAALALAAPLAPAEERAALPQGAAPVRGGALPPPLPLFPPDNWWNRDIRSWPVDANSAAYINFINGGGGCRTLHPDFGGIYPAPPEIIGFPYIVLDEAPLKAVDFYYADESDGVDHDNGHTPF